MQENKFIRLISSLRTAFSRKGIPCPHELRIGEELYEGVLYAMNKHTIYALVMKCPVLVLGINLIPDDELAPMEIVSEVGGMRISLNLTDMDIE